MIPTGVSHSVVTNSFCLALVNGNVAEIIALCSLAPENKTEVSVS